MMPPQLTAGVSVMGIINATPDSFYAPSRHLAVEQAVDVAAEMVAAGAGIIDIGGESTRPGASVVSEAEELDRVLTLVRAFASRFDVILSLDTSRPAVIEAGIAEGASFINDVRALREPGALAAVANSEALVCLMHMKGQPRTMQKNPQYKDLMLDIAEFFQERIEACENAGIGRERLLLDPGFGFGKTPEHNLTLVKHLSQLLSFKLPLLLGVSRKSTIGHVLGTPLDERLPGSLALTALAVWQGVRVLRTHDVKATVEVVKMVEAVAKAP